VTPDLARLAPRALLLGAIASTLLLAALPAQAQNVVSVSNIADDENVAGSLRWALTERPTGALVPNAENLITFTDNMLRSSIGIGEQLPTLVLDVDDGTVDLDGRNPLNTEQTMQISIRRSVLEDESEDFPFLHVQSGRLNVIELDFVSTTGDDPEDDDRVGFVVDDGAILGWTSEEERTLDDAFSGGGTFVKEGTGTLTLRGDSDTWTGDTEVLEGELRGDANALRGDFLVEEEAILNFEIADEDDFQEFDGQITGEGMLIKSGDGELELDGTQNDHTGGTEIQAGMLTASVDNIAGDVSVADGAIFHFSQFVDGEFAGNISGDGVVGKTGGGEVHLTGENSFEGGLLIEGGEVRGDTTSIPGAVEVASATEVRFDQASAGTHSGDIIGEGALDKLGTGTLTLRGSNSYEGGTQVLAGRLRGDPGSLQGSIALSGGTSLEFNHDDNGTFSGSISGNAEVLKTGSGQVTFDTAQPYSGETRIEGGTLRLETDLTATSRVRVESGGRLFSANTISALDASGRVTPGANMDTLVVQGGATLDAGSIFDVQADAIGGSSTLQIQGNGQVQGGDLHVRLESGDYAGGITNTVVRGNDALAPIGNFGGFGNQDGEAFAFVDLSSAPAAGSNAIELTIVPNTNSLADFAENPNQAATATALGEMLAAPDASPDVALVLENLYPLGVSEVPPLLDTLAGESLSVYTNARLANARYFSQSLSRRFVMTRIEPSRAPPPSKRPKVYRKKIYRPKPKTPENETPALETPPVDADAPFWPSRTKSGMGVWVEPFGIFGKNEAHPGASPTDSNLYGFTGGFDYRLREDVLFASSDNLRFGLGLGYTRSSVSSPTGRLDGSANIFQTGAYGAWDSERFYLGLAGRYAYSDMWTERHIVITDLDRTARGEFGGNEGGIYFETGLHLGNPRKLYFHPLASFQWTTLGQDDFAETGAGSLGLNVARADWNSNVTRLGARLSRVFTLRGEYGIEPELRFAWAHEFGDRNRHVSARFQGTPSASTFVTNGAEPDRDTFQVGAGYMMRAGAMPLLTMNYDANLSSHETWHTISVGLLLSW
jgi:outer membrane autotransporter protein